jgi:hypothetical protein
MERTVLCFAHGHEGAWEAICLDYDIAVAGRSFEEVKAVLGRAIATYVEDALKEDERTRRVLLNRRAPLHVRLRHITRFLSAALHGRRRDREAQVGFSMPCPI